MLVPTFQKKAPLSASDLNILGDAVRRARVLPGVGIKLTETLNGTIVSLKPSRGAGSEATQIRPWDVINITGVGQPNQDGSFSSYKANVQPGTINGILPNNLLTSGGLTDFTFSGSLQKWKGRCYTDGKTITQCDIIIDQNDAQIQTLAPNGLPAQAEFVFAITKNGVAYRTLGDGNPSASTQFISTDKTSSPPPGVPGVDRWYYFFFG